MLLMMFDVHSVLDTCVFGVLTLILTCMVAVDGIYIYIYIIGKNVFLVKHVLLY